MTVRELIQEFVSRCDDLDDLAVIQTADGRRVGFSGIETLVDSTPRAPGVIGLKLLRPVSTTIQQTAETQ